MKCIRLPHCFLQDVRGIFQAELALGRQQQHQQPQQQQPRFPMPCRDGLGRQINAMATQLATAVENHARLNHRRRLLAWCRLQVEAAAAAVAAAHLPGVQLPDMPLRSKVADKLRDALLRGLAPGAAVQQPQVQGANAAWLHAMVQRLSEARSSPLGVALSAADTKQSSVGHLLVLHRRMQLDLHAYQQAVAQQQQQQQPPQHVVVNSIHQRVKTLCRQQVVSHLPQASRRVRKRLTNAVYSALLSPEVLPGPALGQAGLDAWVIQLRMARAEELGIMSHKRWFAWQQLLQWWQQLGPVWVPRPQRRPWCPPSWCLLPEPSFMPTYVDIDDSQVQQWVKQPWARQPFKVPMVLPTHPPPTTRAYRLPDAAPPHWMGLFPGVSHFATRNAAFRHHIQTDGVGASITMEGRDGAGMPARAGMPEWRRQWLSVHQQAPANVQGKLCIGVDPGARDVAWAAVEMPAAAAVPAGGFTEKQIQRRLHTARVQRFSVRSFHHRSGAHARKKWQEGRMRGNPRLQMWQSQLPATTGAVTAQQLRQHLRHLGGRLVEVLAHYGTRQQRQRRWRGHVQRQQAMHQAMQQLIGHGRDPKSVVVAWGSASAGRGSVISRGWGFPSLEFHNYMRYHGAEVRLVDEFRTSRCCSRCCTAEDVNKFRTSDGDEPHALRRCQACRRLWNRDSNASLNMLRILLWEPGRGVGSRPVGLQRQQEEEPSDVEEQQQAEQQQAAARGRGGAGRGRGRGRGRAGAGGGGGRGRGRGGQGAGGAA